MVGAELQSNVSAIYQLSFLLPLTSSTYNGRTIIHDVESELMTVEAELMLLLGDT